MRLRKDDSEDGNMCPNPWRHEQYKWASLCSFHVQDITK